MQLLTISYICPHFQWTNVIFAIRKIQEAKKAGEGRTSLVPRGPSRARGLFAGSDQSPAPANVPSPGTSEAGRLAQLAGLVVARPLAGDSLRRERGAPGGRSLRARPTRGALVLRACAPARPVTWWALRAKRVKSHDLGAPVSARPVGAALPAFPKPVLKEAARLSSTTSRPLGPAQLKATRGVA